jgi:hypothetical protein
MMGLEAILDVTVTTLSRTELAVKTDITIKFTTVNIEILKLKSSKQRDHCVNCKEHWENRSVTVTDLNKAYHIIAYAAMKYTD